jgi:hypothetical protein
LFTLDHTTQFAPTGLDAQGNPFVQFSNLTVGPHRISVSYGGDANYKPSSTANDFTINVARAVPNVAVTASPTSAPQGVPVTFTATATPASDPAGTAPGPVTGSVKFYYDLAIVGGVPVPDPAHQIGTQQTLVSGQASVSTSALAAPLAAGAHTIYAVYSGDANFQTHTGSTTYTVGLAATTTKVLSSAPTSVYGQSVTFAATVASVVAANGVPAGNVTFKVDAGTPSEQDFTQTVNLLGNAQITLSTLPVGSHTVEAAFHDSRANAVFADSSATLAPPQRVNPTGTATTLTTSLNPSPAGLPVTFTATVRATGAGVGVPDGTVTFFVNGALPGRPVPVVGGVASLPITFPVAGTFTVTAAYSSATGSGNFSNSGAAVSERVVPFASVTALRSSANPSVSGQAVTFTATVRGGPVTGLKNQIAPGTVTFLVNGVARATRVLNTSGQAFFQLAFPAGSFTVQAVYNGSASYAASRSVLLTQKTNPANTTTRITSNRNPAYPGQLTVVTATVAPVFPGRGVPGGTVTFSVDGNPVGTVGLSTTTGQASLSLGALPLGPGGVAATHVITATYNGSGNDNASTGQFGQQVRPAAKLSAFLIGNAVINTPFDIHVLALGADNSFVPGFNGPATLTVLSVPAGGALSGPLTATFSGGSADFGNLTVNARGTYKVRISSGGLFVDLSFNVTDRVTA